MLSRISFANRQLVSKLQHASCIVTARPTVLATGGSWGQLGSGSSGRYNATKNVASALTASPLGVEDAESPLETEEWSPGDDWTAGVASPSGRVELDPGLYLVATPIGNLQAWMLKPGLKPGDATLAGTLRCNYNIPQFGSCRDECVGGCASM